MALNLPRPLMMYLLSAFTVHCNLKLTMINAVMQCKSLCSIAKVLMWRIRERFKNWQTVVSYVEVKLQWRSAKINNMWLRPSGQWTVLHVQEISDTCVRGWSFSCCQPWESYRSVWTGPTVGMFPALWEMETNTQEVSFVQPVCIPHNTQPNVLCNPLDKE